MKDLTQALQDHLAGEVTTLASCWRLERRDGAVFRFTDHDADLVIEGETYEARAGITRSAVETSSGMAVDNMDVAGILDSESLDERALRAGLFDYAEIRVFLVNWQDPDAGRLDLRRGWIGEVKVSRNGAFSTELRGLAQTLGQTITEMVSPECRADLGDTRCGVDLSAFERAGTVLLAEGREAFTAEMPGAAPEAGYYAGGLLTWTSGQNAGRSVEVAAFDAGAGHLATFLPALFAVAAGDTFVIRPGCDKRLETCRAKFDNVVNFRGEPHLPGQTRIMDYPDAP